MKKLLLFAAMLTFVGFASAQEKKAANIDFKTNFEQWAKAVDLTDAQIAEVQKIDAEVKEQRAAIRSTATAKDFQKINADRDARIEALLTPAQREKNKAYTLKLEADKNKKVSK